MAEEQEKPDFGGLRVIAFESRCAAEMQTLIANAGGRAASVLSMREVALQGGAHVEEFVRRLLNKQLDAAIFLTSAGTRLLARALDERLPRKRWIKALSSARLIARAPAVRSALQELQLDASLTAPEPHTWRDVVTLLDSHASQWPLHGSHIALQEYGLPSRSLVKALKTRGVEVTRVALYHWSLPEDTGPLLVAIDDIVEGRHDVALFTNGTQVWHLFKLAYRKGMEEELRAGFERVVVASIGPTTSEALREFEVGIDCEPAHATMQSLVEVVARQSGELLQAKRSASAR
jgi:uroporphyrinogen-III synthase